MARCPPALHPRPPVAHCALSLPPPPPRPCSDGARAYLLTQYKWLSLWVAILFVLVSVLLGPVTSSEYPIDGLYTGISFVIGAFFSGFAGYLGMLIATQANGREHRHESRRKSCGRLIKPNALPARL